MPPPAAIGITSSLTPRLPAALTTLYVATTFTPFLALLATDEPILTVVHAFAAVFSTCAGLDFLLRGYGITKAVIGGRYPTGTRGNGRAQGCCAPTAPRSHSTVSPTPSRTPIRARQPSSRSAFSTLGQRRTTSTANDGSCSSAK